MDGILAHTSSNDALTESMLLNRITIAASEPSSSESTPNSSSYLSVTIAVHRKKKSAHILSAPLANLYLQQKLLLIYLWTAILTADVLYQCSMNVWAMLQNCSHLFAGGELILLSGQQQFITVHIANFPQFSHLLH
jgi:hypothetical protein